MFFDVYFDTWFINFSLRPMVLFLCMTGDAAHFGGILQQNKTLWVKLRERWEESHKPLQGHAANDLMTCQQVPTIKSFTTSFQCHTGHPTFGGHSGSKYYLRSTGVHVQMGGDTPFRTYPSSAQLSVRLDTVFPFRTSVIKQLLRCLIVFVFLSLTTTSAIIMSLGMFRTFTSKDIYTTDVPEYNCVC